MHTERIAQLRNAAKNYLDAATKLDPYGYNRAGGHEWVADTTDVECVNCGYVKMGSDT